jgi:hypothetical protein
MAKVNIKIGEVITLKWPEGKVYFEEKGKILDVVEQEILFHSDFDGTINWVPKKYVKYN